MFQGVPMVLDLVALCDSPSSGEPVILNDKDPAGQAYADLVARFLGEERPHRFVIPEKKGLFIHLFG